MEMNENTQQHNLQGNNYRGKSGIHTSWFTTGKVLTLIIPVTGIVEMVPDVTALIHGHTGNTHIPTMNTLAVNMLMILHLGFLAACVCSVRRQSILRIARITTLAIVIFFCGFTIIGIILECVTTFFFFDVQYIPLTFMYIFYYLMLGARWRHVTRYMRLEHLGHKA